MMRLFEVAPWPTIASSAQNLGLKHQSSIHLSPRKLCNSAGLYYQICSDALHLGQSISRGQLKLAFRQPDLYSYLSNGILNFDSLGLYSTDWTSENIFQTIRRYFPLALQTRGFKCQCRALVFLCRYSIHAINSCFTIL